MNFVEKVKAIVGEKNVISDPEKMLDYSHDELALKSIWKLPQAVVFPQNPQQISEIMKLANQERVGIIPRGGATGLSGGCVPTGNEIVLSLEKMNKLIEIDKLNFTATVEAGMRLSEFYSEIEKANLFFPPHPGEESATIGGIIATNAGGARAVKYGVVRNFIRGIEAVLPDGTIISIGGKYIKSSSGYNLLNLIIGSEGTLAIITKAIISLLPPPNFMSTLVVPFHTLSDAISSVPEIIRSGNIPMAVEFVDLETISITEDYLHKSWPTKEGNAHLMIVIDGSTEEELLKTAESISDICSKRNSIDVFIADDKQKQQNILDIRSKIYEALKSYTIELLDISIPRAEIPQHVEKVHEISQANDIWLPTYGHAADGNVHTHITRFTNDKTELEIWQEIYPTVKNEIYEDAIARGGVISGEHGIGLIKKEHFKRTTDAHLIELMKKVKKAFDPNNILNPNKIFD